MLTRFPYQGVPSPREETGPAMRGTAANRFPFSNFKYSFTLFSKFFSSFLHSTCLLSVSYQYLALDGIYHPLRAAVPSNSTRRKRTGRKDITGVNGIVTLSDLPFKVNYPALLPSHASRDYNSAKA